MTIRRLLTQARQQLADTLQLPGNEAAIEADILLRTAMGGVSRAWLIARDTQSLSTEQAQTFDRLLQRRLHGEPVAYILGCREFYGRAFRVSRDVLIPRPDTETLVEAALAVIPSGRHCSVLDLGTGSGAIAISIALQRPRAMVTAIDRSLNAIEIARQNARELNAANVTCLQSNWFDALTGTLFDVIVSNPPYIAEADPHLRQGDLRFEPKQALAAGTDGLDDIRRITAAASEHLAPLGWLMLEHGYDQSLAVQQLMRENGFQAVRSHPDLAGVLRVTAGQKSVQAVTANTVG